jgi:hypothetical protein
MPIAMLTVWSSWTLSFNFINASLYPLNMLWCASTSRIDVTYGSSGYAQSFTQHLK